MLNLWIVLELFSFNSFRARQKLYYYISKWSFCDIQCSVCIAHFSLCLILKHLEQLNEYQYWNFGHDSIWANKDFNRK